MTIGIERHKAALTTYRPCAIDSSRLYIIGTYGSFQAMCHPQIVDLREPVALHITVLSSFLSFGWGRLCRQDAMSHG